MSLYRCSYNFPTISSNNMVKHAKMQSGKDGEFHGLHYYVYRSQKKLLLL